MSNGNIYPAIAIPWGMNSWTPQTREMENGRTYKYNVDKLRGFKQTHQPFPWMNDYGQLGAVLITRKLVFNEDKHTTRFSYKSEIVKPYYDSVHLADYNITEITPTERAARFRLTYSETDNSYTIIDALDDKDSYIKLLPKENKLIGYTEKNNTPYSLSNE